MIEQPSRTPGARPGRVAPCLVLAATLLAAMLAPSCATTMGGLSLEEVSEVPIAFVHWDAEAARRRQEIVDAARSGNRGALPSKLGVATNEGIAALFGVDAASEEGLKRFPGRVALLDARTGELTPFPGTPANARPLAWSRDHRRLLFGSGHIGGAFQIYEFDLDAGELRALSRGERMHLEGDYGRDDSIVMNWIDRSGGRNAAGLTLADRHGTPLRRLVDGAFVSGPRLSPVRDEVVYVEAVNRPERSTGGRDSSSIVLASTGGATLPVALGRGREPVFLPDGNALVYTAETSHGWRLHRIRTDGGGRALLGPSIREERNPAVSPDGRHVVYVSPGDDGVERLYIRRIDGTGDRILVGEGAAAWPVW